MTKPPDIQALARTHTEKAVEALVKALRNRDERVRVQAAIALLDRGWGKPTQMLAGDPDRPMQFVIRGPTPVKSTQEWLDRIPEVIGQRPS